jgi:D-tyrosyl-tRNA(Tyr) deacylase
MIGLLQRVSEASVAVQGQRIADIGPGLLVLVGIERGDSDAEAGRLLQRLVSYRVFPDDAGRMNRSLLDTGGELLLVPQFTLAADTKKGTRAGFSTAAGPQDGQRLFEALVVRARQRLGRVAAGEFGAHMQVALVNDGPVTFWLQVRPGEAGRGA